MALQNQPAIIFFLIFIVKQGTVAYLFLKFTCAVEDANINGDT